MEDKHSPTTSLFYSTWANTPMTSTRNVTTPHMHNARLQALQDLQEEIEALRKDIDTLKQVVADKEYDILVSKHLIEHSSSFLPSLLAC